MDLLNAEKEAKVTSLWANLQNAKKDYPKAPPLRKNNTKLPGFFDDLTQYYTKTELEAAAELAKRLEAILQAVLDQYEGLRQINDFRSVSECGQLILQTSNGTNSMLKKLMIIGSILIVFNFLQQAVGNKEIVKMYLPSAKDEFLEMNRHEHNMKLATDNILLEYCKLKAGLLAETGYFSSVVEKENGNSLNYYIVDQFLTEIYAITEKCIIAQVDLFTKKVEEVEKLPKKRRKIIYAKFGGKEVFAQLAESTLSLLRPWMREWAKVQTSSIIQRELFGKTVEELKQSLNKSKNTMVTSFQELLNNQVPEPLYKFDEILKTVDEELELAATIFGI